MVDDRRRTGESAVSPVVGSIILVAIVVVLAGTTWLIIGLLRDQVNVDPYPQIRFVSNDDRDTVTVQSFIGWTGGDLYWSNVTGSDDIILVDGCDDVNGNDLDGTVLVQVGDVLNCGPGTVTATHPLSNHLLFTTKFS